MQWQLTVRAGTQDDIDRIPGCSANTTDGCAAIDLLVDGSPRLVAVTNEYGTGTARDGHPLDTDYGLELIEQFVQLAMDVWSEATT